MSRMIKLIFMLTISIVYAEDVNITNYTSDYKITYERIDVTADEKMGLVGLSKLFDVNENWYLGGSLYGAVDGERGGFFTVGIDNGFKTKLLPNLELKGGAFVGAGGGGAAPQGGGLMLRPYIETNFYHKDVSFGLGLNHIKFPNGDIESNQIYLLASIPSSGTYLKGLQFANAFDKAIAKLMKYNVKVSTLVEYVVPSSSSKNTDGITKTTPYGLLGIELDLFHDENVYNFFQLAGAGKGESDGYMQVFTGYGYKYQLRDLPVYLNINAGIGAAGGGRVDTGGGFASRIEGGVSTQLTEHLSVDLKAGVLKSLSGSLSAKTYSGMLGYTVMMDDSLLKHVDLSTVSTEALSLRVFNKSYLDSDKLFKSTSRNEQVDLLGFALDSYINKNVYLTGQTYWAYEGNSGGYAEGFLGAGLKSNSYADFNLYTEAIIGVGGGGGINTGGGFLTSIGAGVAYHFGNNLQCFVGSSYVQGKSNTLASQDITYGLSYQFSLLAN